MEIFPPELLDEFISAHFMKKVQERFHFSVEQTVKIQTVAKEMLQIGRAHV